jgi:hypothetical protein
MSDSLSVELRESRGQQSRDFLEVEVALASRARVIPNGTGSRRPLVMAAVLAYRSELRQVWGPVLLDLMAPAILASLKRLRAQPPVMDVEDLRQSLVLEVLSAAAEMPLPATPSHMRRRLMARANQGVRRWLERESRRQRRQRSFEMLETKGSDLNFPWQTHGHGKGN